MLRPLVASLLLVVVLAGGGAATASAQGADGGTGTSAELTSRLTALLAQVDGKSSLNAAALRRVHADKATLIAASYGGTVRGLVAADVLTGLDCVATQVQRARNAGKRGRAAPLRAAEACRATLAGKVRAAGGAAPGGLAGDLATARTRLASITSRAKAGRAFGAKSTELRRALTRIATQRFSGATLHQVALGATYADLECVDVKAEAGRISGAAACARRLLKTARTKAPASQRITFGSDLSGTPTVLPVTFPAADTEFWTAELTAPADGRITALRLKVGDSPTALPLRFSVVRPQPDGTVVVVTTTHPPFPLEAHSPGIKTYDTSGLMFPNVPVKKGDIVTVDNSGTTVPGAYVWFAQRDTSTTLSHSAGGDSQNAGQIWRGVPQPGYETLLQVEMQPS
jgi:hypothetical protein